MSSVETANEAAGTIGSDRFVEISYDDVIPNNVDLSSDKQLQRALETWRPNYLDWWNDMGPEGYQQSEVYLRTAVGVDPSGWAKFGHVKMPAYRWGILLAPESRGTHDPLRPPQGRAGVAGGAGRVSVAPAPADRGAGRHRARLRRAAALSRRDRAQPLRHAQPFPGQCRGRPPPVGDGLSAW